MPQPAALRVIQNAWVVDDVEVAAGQWSKTFGIGPFFVAKYGPDLLQNVLYRGRPAELSMRTAIAYAGDIQIELVEPLGDGPSAYRDAFPEGRGGFHHVCVWSDDVDADLARYASEGSATANQGQMKDGPRFAYVDARASLGCHVELLEHSASVAKFFAWMAKACASWDGKDPIRNL